ncbi:hypothetical protein Dsin_012754 [Dipteronia sinensis]|uniref:Uncharacterized protein n=1 Tax=Dipteronia sinensis TaxID=43782 RepID=A0AAE0E8G8_9ROSI|nr:hypothetical protein Dsin_012754 [Dipteronia sinensis]
MVTSDDEIDAPDCDLYSSTNRYVVLICASNFYLKKKLKEKTVEFQIRLPLLFFPAKGEVISEPLVVVLIFASWNFHIRECYQLY